MGKNDPWKFIHEALNSIDKYYGIEIKDSIKRRASNDIINNLAEYGRITLPKQVYARCIDGKIRKGNITDRLVIEMLGIRSRCPSLEMNQDSWETLLANYGDPEYTYCFDSKTFHSDIPPAIGIYLMRHKCSKNIYNILLNNLVLTPPVAECEKVFKFFIKKEKSIMSKVDMFREQLEDTNERVDKRFAWNYANKIIRESGPKVVLEIDSDKKKELQIIADSNNIVFSDIVYRVSTGMSIEDAIAIGKSECEKYGFRYEVNDQILDYSSGRSSLNGLNYNIMMYIKYLAGTEELEGCNIEE